MFIIVESCLSWLRRGLKFSYVIIEIQDGMLPMRKKKIKALVHYHWVTDVDRLSPGVF